ncbi:MAG: tRNA (guanosine(37)-N1)-methyltransferase TrmD [Alphaproteobacteria bacterium]|nr:tRNA (guanosine(37)-N1)-methyltransferase TrmD [Alphaproteobacteria bacterium]
MANFSVKVLTIFPSMFPGPLGESVVGAALKKKLWSIEAINIRDFAADKHKTVDDYPVGGGGGMLMKPDVLGNAIDRALDGKKQRIIYLSPRGKLLNQRLVRNIVDSKDITLICGRYEGIDQRVLDHYDVEEVSIGDYVISGGEMAAYVLIDSCVRMIPGVLKNEDMEESFAVNTEYEKLLEYPQYTKPTTWNNHKVPEVLLGGNHKKINEWRMKKSLEITKINRPDLLK